MPVPANDWQVRKHQNPKACLGWKARWGRSVRSERWGWLAHNAKHDLRVTLTFVFSLVARSNPRTMDNAGDGRG
jgi:hypothetical protein